MEQILLEGHQLEITFKRLCFQLIENHQDFKDTVIIGIQPRGTFVSDKIHSQLQQILPSVNYKYGFIDPTFHRDDIRSRKNGLIMPSAQKIDFGIDGKKVILIDDVLYTGRTIRAALDALVDFGRPSQVELLVLVDRRYSRHLPIEADYVGIVVDTRAENKIKVQFPEVAIKLIKE
jgi:pyrimidine operon attenuation protein/uracil phosphoribosyltransferase